MSDNINPAQGKTDAVEIRAAEIAKREGRDTISDEDRKHAFSEMKKTSPPPAEVETEYDGDHDT